MFRPVHAVVVHIKLLLWVNFKFEENCSFYHCTIRECEKNLRHLENKRP